MNDLELCQEVRAETEPDVCSLHFSTKSSLLFSGLGYVCTEINKRSDLFPISFLRCPVALAVHVTGKRLQVRIAVPAPSELAQTQVSQSHGRTLPSPPAGSLCDWLGSSAKLLQGHTWSISRTRTLGSETPHQTRPERPCEMQGLHAILTLLLPF